MGMQVWMKRKEGIWLLFLLAVLVVSACSAQTVSTTSPSLPENANRQPGVVVRVEEVIIAMLFIAAIVGLVAQRFGIPYTIGLVVVGFGLAFLPQIEPLNIS